MEYKSNMKYDGKNKFISTSISNLNKMNSTTNGNKLLSSLMNSKNKFDFKNSYSKDSKGNDMKGAATFVANKDGGGTVNAAGLMESGIGESTQLETVAHELFHGFQSESGQGQPSIRNEVEAYLFGYSLAMQYSFDNNEGFAGSAGLGMDGPIGAAYEKSFNNLMNEFSEDELNSAVTNFKQGSQKNIGGIYNRHPENPPIKKPSLLKGFYPLLK
ncbi:M91 family zinc metallopeptidase [Flavobacterium tructae]|uniref:M91 family zinc metallopeptidase n=1 Tax=Flavobacterium tructae TaxID=1114873 RepID=UPI0032D98E70